MRSRTATFSASPNVHTQNMADVTVSGTLDWFGWREEVAIGADFMRFKVRSDTEHYSSFGERLGDVRAFDPDDYPDPRLTGPPQFGTAMTSTRDEYGIFAALRVYFDNAWSIVGGARLSGDSTDSQTTYEHGGRFGGSRISELRHRSSCDSLCRTDVRLRSTLFSVRQLRRHLPRPDSASGAGAGKSSRTRAGGECRGRHQRRMAQWCTQWIVGAVPDRAKQPSKTQMPLQPANPDPRVPRCCYTGVSSKSRGVDVELSGELMPRWTLSAGYTYNENEYPGGAALSTFTPKHLLKAWTNVTLPGAFNRWQIGGGLHAQSETTFRTSYCSSPSRCVPVDFVQPAYAVLDLRAGFDVDRNWRIALTVNNVLDKTYYESISTPPLQGWYGEPRNWVLRIDGRY